MDSLVIPAIMRKRIESRYPVVDDYFSAQSAPNGKADRGTHLTVCSSFLPRSIRAQQVFIIFNKKIAFVAAARYRQ